MNAKYGLPHENATVAMAALSDLFFNWDAPTLAAFDRNTPDDDPDFDAGGGLRRAAVLTDAVDFCRVLKDATGVELDPEEVTDDYLRRE